MQNTWRLIDDYLYTKVLSKAISHTVHWFGSFVEGKIAISLKNYRNVPFALSWMTSQRVSVKGQTLCLFHSIVFFLLGIEMYKCVNGFNPTYLNDLFTAQSNDYNLQDSSRLIQLKFNTFKFGFKLFRYFGAKLWNVLPIDIKRSESWSIFKRSITARCRSDAAKASESKCFEQFIFACSLYMA